MTLLEMLASVGLWNMLSFGQAMVLFAIVQRTWVQEAHVLTNAQLLYAFAVARVTPGQVNLYVAAIGYMLFGLLGAAGSVLVLAAPAYLMLPLTHGYRRFRENVVVYRLIRGLAATAVGLAAAATWGVVADTLTTPLAWIVMFIGFGLLTLTRLPTVVSLVAAAGAGAALVLLTGLS